MIGDIATFISLTIVAISIIMTVDLHSHRCMECGAQWRHTGLFSGGSQRERRARLAHTCKCGVEMWIRGA